MSIRLTGTTTRAAHSATGTDGSAWLDVHMAQADPKAAPVVAKRCYGTGHAAQAAATNAAWHLRHRGAQVTVHAKTFDIRLHPHPHIVLYGVELIEQLHQVQVANTEKEHA